jgi:hypothetical protein
MGARRRCGRDAHRRPNPRFAAVLLPLALTLVAAACSSDTPATTSTTRATTTTTVTTTTAPPTTTTTTIPAALLAGSWVRLEHSEDLFGSDAYVIVRAVTTGGPGLVAVGEAGAAGEWDAAAWNSTDGSTWLRIPRDESALGGDQIQVMWSVASNGSHVAAVGWQGPLGEADAVAWLSMEGILWNRLPDDPNVFGGPDDQIMRSVASAGHSFIAVGWDGPTGATSAAVWTSESGWIWSRIANTDEVFGDFDDQGMYAVTAGGPGFVAVGWDGSNGDLDAAVWTSPNGSDWTRVEHDEGVFGGADDQGMYAVTAGGPGLVAVGWDGPSDNTNAAVWTSVDGLTWARVGRDEDTFGGAGSQAMYAVTAGGPGLVAVGDEQIEGGSDAVVWVSTDGTSWARLPADEGPFAGDGNQSMYGVVSTGSGLIAVGNDGGDGAIWYWMP